MTRNLEGRLSKLEGQSSNSDISVWCDEDDQVEATFADMIDRGEIKASDRSRCVYWVHSRGTPGAHERSLEELN